MTLSLSILSTTWIACVSASPAHPKVSCETLTAVVATADGEVRIEGDYCQPRSGPVHTVQVLTHGATYDRRYWQAPSGPSGSDPVRQLVKPGLAVFNYDRLGSGQSDHPPSLSVTVDRHADVLHGVITNLREGTIGGGEHTRVVSIGHSLGSIVAATEAAIFQDVDALVLTGFSHTPSEEAQARFAAALQPAALDLAFSDLDAGYFTTRPGSREGLFYPPGATAEYIAYDDATKGVVAAGEFAGPTFGDLSEDIACPVLILAGALDPFACDDTSCASSWTLAEQERAFFTMSPRVDAMVLLGRGHALTGGARVGRWIGRLHAWLRRP